MGINHGKFLGDHAVNLSGPHGRVVSFNTLLRADLGFSLEDHGHTLAWPQGQFVRTVNQASHDHCSVLLKSTSLLWFCAHVTPHILSVMFLDLDLALFDLIIHKEAFFFDMLCLLGAGHSTIHLQ